MIIVKLMGGMGNQMFQYSFGRSLSVKFKMTLKLDLSFLKNRNMGPNFVYRDYDLDIYNILEDFNFTNDDVMIIGEQSLTYDQKIVDSVYENFGKKIMIDGYWATYKYFLEYDNQIRKDFEFKDKVENSTDDKIIEMYNNIVNNNSIMINVRRTDFLNTNFHGVMGVEYINKAVDIIKSKVDNPHYFIFSDDIDWCKENIKLDNMTIVDHYYKGNKFGYYLQLMKVCKHFIIPNSTFAWWAAWLNENDNKIVIAPKKWLTDENINTSDLIPNNWLRI